MAKDYPTGPIDDFIDQAKNLQTFREKNKKRFDDLSHREKEVLALIAEGYNNPEIAERLDISRATVQNHRANVRDKLAIKTDVDYMKFALAFDVVKLL